MSLLEFDETIIVDTYTEEIKRYEEALPRFLKFIKDNNINGEISEKTLIKQEWEDQQFNDIYNAEIPSNGYWKIIYLEAIGIIEIVIFDKNNQVFDTHMIAYDHAM